MNHESVARAPAPAIMSFICHSLLLEPPSLTSPWVGRIGRTADEDDSRQILIAALSPLSLPSLACSAVTNVAPAGMLTPPTHSSHL